MKGIVEERAIELGEYIIESKATVRKAAKKFGVSKTQSAYTKKSKHSLMGTLSVYNNIIADAFAVKMYGNKQDFYFKNLCILLCDTRWCPQCNAVLFTA